jgi:hypothetical protein
VIATKSQRKSRLRRRRALVGSIVSGVLMFFALAAVPEQAQKWSEFAERTWSAAAPFLTADLARLLIFAVAIGVLVWAWWPRPIAGAQGNA